MIGHKPWHGVAHYLLNRSSKPLGHSQQNVAIFASNRAHKTHGIFFIVILTDITLKETHNFMVNQVVHIGVVEVVGKKKS